MIVFAFIWKVLKWIWHFAIDNWKVVLPAIVLIFVVVFVYRACRKPPKIDEAAIQKINSANERERKAELQKVIEENADVVKTVDNRSVIADTNVVERNRLIDEKVAEADRKIQEAKASGRDVTAEELECLLIGNCE